MEKEKGVIIEEINMYEDMPQSKVGDVYMELLYGKQPAGMPVIGPKENIQKMQREDFLKYRQAHYVPSATAVIVSGRMNEKKVIKEVESIFSKLPKAKKEGKETPKEIQKSPAVKLFFKDTDRRT